MKSFTDKSAALKPMHTFVVPKLKSFLPSREDSPGLPKNVAA
eukprot:CAMPEP_0197002098 /NCGR_PEP_ID=MMETSP1380-20130617/6655_1 /TAXON_ID=5936 /ORGANISM="Euplotes crassus, Strain CT5" /LENGTH=41 /DNA_ID= /DNA_START= /DNA_END= /DNA_ORIENTATION=